MQRAFYELCGSIIHNISSNPSVLGLSTERPDEWLNAHMVMSMRPELYKVRNECQKAFNDLSCFLFVAGTNGEYKNGRLIVQLSDIPNHTAKTLAIFIKLLESFGLFTENRGDSLSFEFPDFPEALSAWQLLAVKCSEYPDRQREQAIRFCSGFITIMAHIF